ncbi:MAG TPA: N-6 DNA methylase, partial [Ktedonobacteraceae bacterium]|nr:N-6 DNA methylase [Ktedonobacteraceae bacterium]
MSTPQFDTAFAQYLSQAKEARDHDLHHDHRRQLFLAFLKDAFDIQQADVEIEKYIRIANAQVPVHGIARVRKGWIDAIFHDLIFEFKRDLAKEEADGLRELRDYLSTIYKGSNCVGLLTDGLKFTAYVLDTNLPNSLRRIDEINLETALPSIAYMWLDAYLLRQQSMPPTSADIVRRFGLNSPTFVAAAQSLREALKIFAASEVGALEVKRQQWAFHLARVYGYADVSSDEMFVRHTYLCQFAKILAFTAHFGVGEVSKRIEGVIDGKAFEIMGFNNIGEQDFFAWVLAPEVRASTLAIFNHIAASLVVYDLSKINEDLLKQLYQNLVEPETRHELGEFYTPDWLAELTLREIGYQPGQSLLDPACGSGTFLFSAIRLLAEQGLRGQELVDFAVEHIMGIDVHPLAVTIAKINYMLAILPHMRESSAKRRGQYRSIPITMANALQVPSTRHHIEVIDIPIDNEHSFQIPVEAARNPGTLTEVLNYMGRYAMNMAKTPEKVSFGEFSDRVTNLFASPDTTQDTQFERLAWGENARSLTRQIMEGRDSIWIYVLQNTTRPLFLRYRKFDVVIGNPPWIAYRYLRDQTYQAEIKKLMQDYLLIAPGETKLHTQMELATLFFEHCRLAYLKPEGTIAFVMPRSVVTGAKQHQAFQQRGFTRVLDLKDVEPLFNVETCVMIRSNDQTYQQAIPTTSFEGRLPAHECSLSDAATYMTRQETVINFARQETIASPYYYPKMHDGANLYPRNLAFVTTAHQDLLPGQLAWTPSMKTDPELNDEAKIPWKGLHLETYIDDDFLYATLLSKHLVPFGIGKLHLVALPFKVGIPRQLTNLPGKEAEERFIPMSLQEIRETLDLTRSVDDWFEPVERLWQKYKKPTIKETLAQWFNYQNKLTSQSAAPGYMVLYGAAGSNLAASVIDTHSLPIIGGAQPVAFAVDHTTYWYRSDTEEEAHFLVALLNAPCVDSAIKQYQTRGLFGARHIHRRPFEVCAIPQFDKDNPDHLQLATLSQVAHDVIATLDLSHTKVVAARKQARLAVSEQIEQIDAIAQRLLGLAPALQATIEDDEEEGSVDPY